MTAVATGWGCAVVVGGSRRRRAFAGLGGALAVIQPAAALVCGAGLALVGAVRRRSRRRANSASIERELVVLADLIALGLAAGMPVRAALGEARDQVHPTLGDEIDRVLVEADGRGLAAALADASGVAERLFRLLGRSVVSGAPSIDAVESFSRERRHAEHAAALTEARRLPVRLLLPLALLILPGFVVLAVGPALLDAMDRLGGIGG